MTGFLFDSTYILPFFRINVAIPNLRDTLLKLLPLISGLVFISTCSLIEGKWKALREYNKSGNEDFLLYANQALESLATKKYFQLINSWAIPEINYWVDDLFKRGVRDYMDCWISGTAKAEGLILVTEDKDLKKVIQSQDDWKNQKLIN